MDCSKTEVFLKEWGRMCEDKSHYARGYHTCEGCGIGSRTGSDCKRTASFKPEEVIKIVQEWSDSHPVKTRLSEFNKQFPNANKKYTGIPDVCVASLYGIACPALTAITTAEMCEKCWNTPIEDGKCSSYVEGETPRCMGTKEIDVCSCGGDKSKCDFYPQGVQT